MECISVFDMLKIGVGPSSSHTLGPWRAAERWINHLKRKSLFEKTTHVRVELYGSLSLTGKGHATDLAVILGLAGFDPELIETSAISSIISKIKKDQSLLFGGKNILKFNPDKDIVFNNQFLDFHANGIKFTALTVTGHIEEDTYFSIGGGFVVREELKHSRENLILHNRFPFPIQRADELADYCKSENSKISEIVLQNEFALQSESTINSELKRIWLTMLQSMFDGCHTKGTLPGGLNVKRRAYDLHAKLIGDQEYRGPEDWMKAIRKTEIKFRQILKWVSCFALSVNEVNASLGRVVTAPTNGSAGVIPAVLMYYLVIENHEAGFDQIKQFLLVAGEIGSIFKKGATISAAMGGCQAEIGVSSAMAAGALTELLGGTPDQVLMASEIAMEHHLGLTCDPIGGLVQIPCIERNAMGAIKAISAAELAMESDSSEAKIPLDKVIESMWETAKDMNSKYKETSTGGLAVSVNLPDC